MTSILVVPGLNGSGPDHWQTWWEATRGDCVRVEQASWHDPEPGAWTAAIDAAVRAAPSRVVFAAHSLGCAAVAHWAARHDTAKVGAALLVAPCDVERPGAPASITRFAPFPAGPLPFRSVVVASSNDPFATRSRSRCFSERWGSALVDAGALGHINAASQLGSWGFGQVLVDELVAQQPDPAIVERAAALRAGNPPRCGQSL